MSIVVSELLLTGIDGKEDKNNHFTLLGDKKMNFN